MPIVHGLEKKYGAHITFVRANIHNKDTWDLQEQLGFSTTPEFFLLDVDGTVLGHWDDTLELTQLEETLADVAGQ